MPIATQLTIDRSKWHRGVEAAEKDAFIFNKETGKYDVSGFILTIMGHADRYLDGKRLPSVVAHSVLPKNKKFPSPYQWLVTMSHADTEDTLELIKLNDDPLLKEDERESKIAHFLSQRGITTMFVDSPGDKPRPAPNVSTWGIPLDIETDVDFFDEEPDPDED